LDCALEGDDRRYLPAHREAAPALYWFHRAHLRSNGRPILVAVKDLLFALSGLDTGRFFKQPNMSANDPKRTTLKNIRPDCVLSNFRISVTDERPPPAKMLFLADR